MSHGPTGFPSRPFSYGILPPEIVKQMVEAPSAGAAKEIEKQYMRKIGKQRPADRPRG